MNDAGNEPKQRSASVLMVLTYVAGGIGLAVAGGPSSEGALKIVTLTVGAVSVISFVRHSIFHRADAARMGWESGHAGFQIEVGFANLAMGLVAIATVVWAWGAGAEGAVVLTYALYILQSAIIHAVHAIRGAANRRHETITAIAGFTLAVVLAWYAIADMGNAGLRPF